MARGKINVDKIAVEEVEVKKETVAKTTEDIKIGEEVIISSNLNKKLKEIEDKQEEVTILDVKPVVNPVKMVKIKLSESHKCHIGGEWYTFKANTQYHVPEQVKNILMRKQGLLLPL